jgi:hypothetical protein
MNKLLITLVFTITFTPHIFSMEENSLQQAPQTLPYKYSKRILLELSQNCHRYCNALGYTKSGLVSRIIFNVSLVNKKLYTKLDKQRNDPITARSIITNIRHQYLDGFLTTVVVENFVFPGAKKCRELSAQLYDDNLIEDMVEKLFHQGAILNYSVTESSSSCLGLRSDPLKYWCTCKNKDQSKTIVKKLLDLGANPNECDVLSYVIDTQDIDLIKIILNYKPAITSNTWYNAIQNTRKNIDLLLPCATQDELNDGLYCCLELDNMSHTRETMQKFIDYGANPSIALHYLIKMLTGFTQLDADDDFIKNFNFLCSKGAFNRKALIQLQKIQNTLGSLVNELEKNQPSDPFGMEQ